MKSRRKTDHQIDTGSFADIAFLLLIFFMVVTTFQHYSKLKMNNPANENVIKSAPISEKRLLRININNEDEIMIGDEIYSSHQPLDLVSEIKRIRNHPKIGVVAITTTSHASYKIYLRIISALKRAKKDLREHDSRALFQQSFASLNAKQKESILRQTQFKIIEKEL